MSAGDEALVRLAREELARPAPDAARRVAAAICTRTGNATLGVVFYGSCLRRDSAEGVLDFYVIVDDYAGALGPGWLARVSDWLPPSVFYIECPASDGSVLRAKYALLTLEDFARGAVSGGFRSGIWARFCQPALAPWVRDEAALESIAGVCAQSVRTAVETVTPLLEGPSDAEEFWQTVFAETYRRELRSESVSTIRSLHAAAPERYERALRAGLAACEQERLFAVEWSGPRFALEWPAGRREKLHRRFRRRIAWAKCAYVAQLLKTAFTFGDWLPYALWKVERHTGAEIPYTERQRRHPLIFGWPLLFRVLHNRELR
ncbi:MAG: hypothetical protein QF890_18180 [Myxococcota bacterium]|nr:hypothetical protein [Deltaproteobacteria bacterium]MCP4242117.1 hypothetical protein [bacterium]MDP6075192.1 hypothetical protein [Myxococcota bacterium]MDP6243829.1 hypothetical protein [Myxococcota bacterium]MDP7075041.1 hypothetical protein [Myxococcota bacterium]